MQPRIRERHTYAGVVQGVGFRPAVFRGAISLGLTGRVRNERSVVVVEVQGDLPSVAAFHETLRRSLPPAARVDRHSAERVAAVEGESDFRIEESLRTPFTLPPVPPDLALCADCLLEILDPVNRRYLYPFVSCTQCGPRYTIVRDTPFDRENTSMAAFPLCPECLREYRDPADRRFHAQTTACPRCGPVLEIRDAGGRRMDGEPLLRAIRVLAEGGTVALLGLGGFHLAADPRSGAAIGKLRRNKDRERKPFALMVRDLEVARGLVVLSLEDEALLSGPAAPIVILPALPEAALHMRAVSDTGTLGIMLPYTPLHHLLFRHPGVTIPYDTLVMTSGNLRDEPIITDPGQAFRELAGVADVYLVHNRAVVFRTDDTVMRPAQRGHLMLRRSRGYVPGTFTLSRPVDEPTLAVGGDLKAAPALALGTDVYLAPHVGDLDSLPTRDAFEEHIRGILALYRVEPTRVVHDAHPGYVSTQWALGLPWGRKIAVQHHHAHILSVMAEHGLEEALGLSFDGTGYGTDGTIWGGEMLRATRSGFLRLASFAPFPLPGGDAAIRHPLRTAYALLRSAHPREAASLPLEPEERALLDDMIQRGVSVVATSSLGRLFDAAAAALGLVREQSYEGEGPIRLEGLAAAYHGASVPTLSIPQRSTGAAEPAFVLDGAPAVAALVELGARGLEPAALALAFHRAVSSSCHTAALGMREATGLGVIALSGGVFQNTLLRSLLVPALEEAGFVVCLNRQVPPGDGGLALGQAWFAGLTP